MDRIRQLTRDLGGFAVIVGLLLLVNFLPPDTSLSEVRATNAIRVCVPTAYPPLVTGDPDRPGIDVEILRAITDYIGVNLLLNPIDAIGRDFNPRNWAVNRAKCQMLAGGVVASTLTRSFLDTSPSYAETGWAIIAPAPLDSLEGRTIGALTIISGLDRISLASYLRGQNVTVRVMRTSQALVDGIASGELDGGITEALLAGGMAQDNDWWIAPMPDELARYDLVFGLWKGDLTLKRKVARAFRQLESDGTLDAILERYGVARLMQEAAVSTF